MSLDESISEWNTKCEALSPQEIVRLALAEFPALVVSWSGAEDVALVHMASRIRPDVRVLSLDTGRLFPETYAYLETIRAEWGIRLEVVMPDAVSVEALVREKGLYSFRTDTHKECCGIRKVLPLRRFLSSLPAPAAWMTGQRRDQSPDTRAEVRIVEKDLAFSTPARPLVKWNPLARQSSADVWAYLREHDIPTNPLHEKGYLSIGCEPCTRPVLPHQHEREGRWWWEASGAKECGLHVGNLAPHGGRQRPR